MKLVKKKDEAELEAMFAGLGSKGKGKGAKKGKKADKKEEKDTGSARIQHSIDTLTSFSKLKVGVPLTMSSVPETVEALKVMQRTFCIWITAHPDASLHILRTSPKH